MLDGTLLYVGTHSVYTMNSNLNSSKEVRSEVMPMAKNIDE